VDGVVRLLISGQVLAAGFLDRDGEEVGRALVAQISQGGQLVGDPLGDVGE
jgi:hypothetical protein